MDVMMGNTLYSWCSRMGMTLIVVAVVVVVGIPFETHI